MRRFIAFGLILIVILAGCSESNEDDNATTTDAVSETVATATTGSDSQQSSETVTMGTESTASSTATQKLEATATSEPTNTPEPTATQPPTATPEPTATATPTPIEAGRGRSNPLPFGEVGMTPDGNWEVQILEVVRGDEAWNRILEANQFNEPAPEGMEYVLSNIRVANRGTEAEAQNVDFSMFNSTGDARVRWSWPSVVEPEPVLDADLFPDGEATGWVASLARSGEQNLMIIFEPLVSFEEGDEIFLAAQEGANVPVLNERVAQPNDLGESRDNPAGIGEHVVTDTWEVWVNEVIHGADALTRIKEANQFNDDPDPGMEYVLVNIGARNIKPDSGSDSIYGYSNFKSTGSNNVVYDGPSVVEPEPALDFDVYAGGEVSGWIALTVAEGETGIKAIFSDDIFGGAQRFLALE